jgi:hypothetical protein
MAYQSGCSRHWTSGYQFHINWNISIPCSNYPQRRPFRRGFPHGSRYLCPLTFLRPVRYSWILALRIMLKLGVGVPGDLGEESLKISRAYLSAVGVFTFLQTTYLGNKPWSLRGAYMSNTERWAVNGSFQCLVAYVVHWRYQVMHSAEVSGPK